MAAIVIRAAAPRDAATIARYHDRCFRSTFSAQLHAGTLRAPDSIDTRAQLDERFESGSGFRTQVAVIDDAPIGHVTVYGRQLVHLFVDPDHQRRGLGRRLLAHGEAMLAGAGHHEYELHARVDNRVAIAFYERAGWTLTDRLVHTVEHGIGYDECVLVKHRR